MEPFIGEIKLCAFAFPPKGWAICNGALISVSQNAELFLLLGTQYGGDGLNTFALPDLRGRVAVHRDADHPRGTMGGLEKVVLSEAQVPAHNHPFNVSSSPGTSISVGSNQNELLAASQIYDAASPASRADGKPIYSNAAALVALASSMCDTVGAGASHDNTQPSLVLNYIIALRGKFPSRN